MKATTCNSISDLVGRFVFLHIKYFVLCPLFCVSDAVVFCSVSALPCRVLIETLIFMPCTRRRLTEHLFCVRRRTKELLEKMKKEERSHSFPCLPTACIWKVTK